MAWIKSEQALASHPKLHMLAEDLGITIPETVGHLHLLWWWALDYCQDGYLTKYRGFIPIASQWQGDKDLFININSPSDLIEYKKLIRENLKNYE